MGGWFGKSFWPVLAVFGLLSLAGPAAATDHHLDCEAVSPGTGTAADPLSSLAAANALELGPGDRLLLRRGSACHGRLTVRAAGSAADPATVGAWGEGEKPRIVAEGPEALLAEDASHLVIEDLDLSNPGAGEEPGESTVLRNGLRLVASTGVSRNVTLRRLDVHDVAGDLTKNPGGSAGILVATGAAPARFEGLAIEDSTVREVSRSAISIYGTADPDRPAAGQPWPNSSHGVVVRGNRIDRIAGDGIVPRGTDGAVVEDNVVSRGNLAGRPILDPRGSVCNAGIWAFAANNTLIRRNEVFGMEHNGCDGTGFDIDYRQDGTVIEGNFSHDNEGGFVLLCSDSAARGGDVRFNLSLDDGSTINHGPCGIASGIIGDLSGLRFFNNTIVAPAPSASVQMAVVDQLLTPGDFRFFNNLLVATGPAEEQGDFACGDHCSHNLFWRLPATGSAAVAADPRLVDPTRRGQGRLAVGQGFRLGAASPARGKGAAIPAGVGEDFFGGPFPVGATPAIGMDQSAAPTPPITRACRQARAAHARILRRVRAARRALAKAPAKARRKARQLKRLKAQSKRSAKRLKRICR